MAIASMDRMQHSRRIKIHPLLVRITHWVNAFAMGFMIMSGWQIYDASPLFPFTVPHWATLGGWLGGAIAWHLAAMWLLVANGLVYGLYGLASGHFRRSFLPLSAGGVWADFKAALTFRLPHRLGHYNAVQRLYTYWCCLRACWPSLRVWRSGSLGNSGRCRCFLVASRLRAGCISP